MATMFNDRAIRDGCNELHTRDISEWRYDVTMTSLSGQICCRCTEPSRPTLQTGYYRGSHSLIDPPWCFILRRLRTRFSIRIWLTPGFWNHSCSLYRAVSAIASLRSLPCNYACRATDVLRNTYYTRGHACRFFSPGNWDVRPLTEDLPSWLTSSVHGSLR